MPVVSVVIAAYNSEKYIRSCLNSLVKQTLEDIEIIVVNDGSKDKTLEIAEEYARSDKRIRVLSQPNKGAGAARNNGISHASGKYLSVLDADDIFDEEMLERAVEKAESGNYDIVVFNVWDYDNITHQITVNNKALNRAFLVDAPECLNADNFGQSIMNFTWGCAWNKLFLREFVEKNNFRFQEIPLADDIFFTLLAMAKANRIGVLPERLLFFRTSNALSQQGQINKTATMFFYAYHALQERLKEEGLYEKVRVSFLNRALNNCIHRLENMLTEYEPYEDLYNKLKNEYFDAFGFQNENKNIFQSKYEYAAYKEISEQSVEQHLFLRNKYLRSLVKYDWHPFDDFPFNMLRKNEKLIIYGTGDRAEAYYRQLYCCDMCTVVMRTAKECTDNIRPPECIKDIEYDRIIIVCDKMKEADLITEELKGLGAAENKLWWIPPVRKTKRYITIDLG